MSIGERLKSARHERHMTLAQLAEASDLTKGFLSQVESGHSLPSLRSLRRLSSALGLPVESLVAGERLPRDGAASTSTIARLYAGAHAIDLERPVTTLASVAGAEVLVFALGPGQRIGIEGARTGTDPADGATFCMVLSGALWFEEAEVSGELAAGDSASLDAWGDFSLSNERDAPATVLLVSSLSAEAFRVLNDVVVPPHGAISAVDANGPLRLVAMRAQRQGRRRRS